LKTFPKKFGTFKPVTLSLDINEGENDLFAWPGLGPGKTTLIA